MKRRGSVALINGASAAIGASLAPELAHQGNYLGLEARRRERLQRLAERIRGRGSRHSLRLTGG